MAYSEADKASALAALAANAGNVSGTAKRLGLPRKTLEDWSKGEHVHEAVAEKCQQKRRELADIFEDMAYQAIDIAAGKIGDATYMQLMTGSAIAVDKMRLLRDQSTDNHVIEVSTPDQVKAMLAVKRAERLALSEPVEQAQIE